MSRDDKHSGRELTRNLASDQAFRDLLMLGAEEMPFPGLDEDVMQRIEVEEALLEQKPAIWARLSSLVSLLIGVFAGFFIAGYVGGIEHLFIFSGQQLSTVIQVVIVLVMLLQLDRILTIMRGRQVRFALPSTRKQNL